ncbi:hypothetical protein RQP53_00575 [Paucibacter sp. APW11]|uniref:Uncharacterized protein n=1 Tax=Roseateles aquae TaxID=3077235 RepID=A0ABU3P6R5_9BURK|nr:hypothetical protein [Paucibacter sp. APW11]MDT8997763.1 hypothetical protein [Paucibacter sp. APW11]
MAGDHSRNKQGRLRQEHIATIEGLIQIHPGISLYRLTQLVGARIGMLDLAYSTLRIFMERHGLAILPAERKTGTALPGTLPAIELGADGITARVHRLRGGPETASETRSLCRVDPNASLADQARQAAADWLDLEVVKALAAAAFLAARRKTWQEPDDADYDPADPAAWFDPFMFAEDVADLFRLAVFRQAERFGVKGAADEAKRLASLGGAEWLPKPAAKRGLGQSPREHAEGSGNCQPGSNSAGIRG